MAAITMVLTYFCVCGLIEQQHVAFAGRTIMDFVADDGDGDEHCYPVSFTEFGSPGSGQFRHQRYRINGVEIY